MTAHSSWSGSRYRPARPLLRQARRRRSARTGTTVFLRQRHAEKAEARPFRHKDASVHGLIRIGLHNAAAAIAPCAKSASGVAKSSVRRLPADVSSRNGSRPGKSLSSQTCFSGKALQVRPHSFRNLPVRLQTRPHRRRFKPRPLLVQIQLNSPSSTIERRIARSERTRSWDRVQSRG